MATLFNLKTHDQVMTVPSAGGTTVTLASDPATYRTISQAEKFWLMVRASQVGGTGALTIAAVLEHSNDGVNWFTKTTFTFAEGATLTVNQINLKNGSDLGTTVVGGAMMRLTITLTAATSNPTAFVEAWLCGRSND